MRPTEEVEKQINKFTIEIRHNKDKQVLDAVLRAQANVRRSTQIDLWQIIMKNKTTKFAVAVVILIVAMLGLSQFGGSIDGTSVAWAEIMRNFEKQLHTNDYIHLVITNRKPIHGGGLSFGDVVKKEEIWVQRPLNMRIEEVYQVNDAPDYMTFTSTTTIYNDEGEFHLVHNRKSWGFRDPDLINVHHKVAYGGRGDDTINELLTAQYYARFDWTEGTYNSPYGKAVDNTRLDGERVTIYEFSEYQGETHLCWLRDKDDRLLRMEVYTENATKPVKTYEVLSYEAPANSHFFEAAIPRDYTNGQSLGYEDQPQLINPEVAAVVIEEESVRFYRLNAELGQTPGDVIGVDEPAFEINVNQPSLARVRYQQSAKLDGSKPRTRTESGLSLAGSHSYGVLLDKNNSEPERIVVMDASEYRGQGQIIFEYRTYQTDYGYCKAAFDADGDGQMDVWCQVPSEEVVAAWRQALTGD